MRSGRRWLSMARYPRRLCSTGVCNAARLESPSADRHCLPGQGAQGQEGPGSRAQVSPPALTEQLYCRNSSFRVITNWAFLLFVTRFPSSLERTSGL